MTKLPVDDKLGGALTPSPLNENGATAIASAGLTWSAFASLTNIETAVVPLAGF